MPRSFDPYLGLAFRIFVDFLFTQSLSRLALVALWSLVGMLLADVAPNVWRDSGLRHLYRQVYKDVRRVKRSVPRIRIKNDLPSVRLFSKSRTASSSSVSGSIRSDRAAPSRSANTSPAPAPGPSRRQGRSPPGTFPDVSGWSDTNTDVSNLRIRVVTDSGPSPALIPSRQHEAYERIDTTHTAISQTQTATIQDTTTTIAPTQNQSVVLETAVAAAALGVTAAATSVEPIDDPSRHDPPMIPDDWVDINHPTPARLNEPAIPLQTDPDPTLEPQVGPSTPTQSRPTSIFVPLPAIDVLTDIPDVDHVNKASRPPEQIPLPESRAASAIGGVYDQPEPRSTLRDSIRSRVGKATSEIGVEPAKSLAPVIETLSTKSQSASRWTSWSRSKLSQSVDVKAPELPPKETRGEPVVGSAAQGPEPQVCTPTQVDTPPSIWAQPGYTRPLLLASESEPVQKKEQPGYTPPLLLASGFEPAQKQEQPQESKPEPPPASAGVDQSPVPAQDEVDKKDAAGPSNASLLDVPTPTRTPPPPFTKFAGVPDGLAAGEGPAGEDPLTQDEGLTELTKEQKAAEEKRITFLSSQLPTLEGASADLQTKLDKEDDPVGSPANAIESDLEDAAKTATDIKARIAKKKFSGKRHHFSSFKDSC